MGERGQQMSALQPSLSCAVLHQSDTVAPPRCIPTVQATAGTTGQGSSQPQGWLPHGYPFHPGQQHGGFNPFLSAGLGGTLKPGMAQQM